MTPKTDVKLALLGCGRVAQHYKKILGSGAVTGWTVVACADKNRAVAGEFAEHFGAKACVSVEEALALKPDLALVLTPSGLHFEHAKAALEAGVGTLIEKPIAMRPDQARELEALGKARRLMCGVAFQNRLNPAVRALKAALDAGRFGRLVTATMRLRWCRLQEYYEDGWHGTWAQDGGVINQQAIHHVDALNWLVPVESVCATIANRMNKLEAEDTLVAAARFSNGALGTLEATTAARPRDFEASLSIVGEKGMAVIGGIALNKIELWSFVEPKPEDADAPARFSQEVPNGYGLSHGPLLQGVIDALQAGKLEPPVPAGDGARTTELIHALYKSAETGAWTRVADKPTSDKLGRAAAGARR